MTTTITRTVATTTTAYLSLLDTDGVPINDGIFVDQAASIVSVDRSRNETTAILNCMTDDLDICSFTLPGTVLIGPSTVVFSVTDTTTTPVTVGTEPVLIYGVWTEWINCEITSSAQTARCVTSFEEWESYSGDTSLYTTVASRNLSAITYLDIPITAGLENLIVSATSTAASTVSSTSTAAPMATSTATGTASSSTSGQPQSSRTSSKAWIAGPVIGGLAGCVLIAAAVYWWMRRNRQAADIAQGTESPSDIPYKAELPADNVTAATGPVVRAELPSPDVDELLVRDPQRVSELA
ncbi:hypothetical protein BO94DRAFT_628236 [Aspergillus sclerotioniger CBS 115572]|uniref:Mid2 domain-containing protein n=1 Tax=Aspergillus sclerotioniger CBS 115572 TaxID=1450535 RepID=A0A317VG63_9EURO|nr:hypothetical protein BO94DRAFT_628236 [Aspergillus sclerotioniger CBS 115572]PWY70830.1 hypothetical protein BO94DRAFT_628236 [Aspergillus sclerotioniger CBS 115572]